MRLYLIRHGTAEPMMGGENRDAERVLLDKGKEQCHWLANILKRLSVKPEAVVSSPLKRAQQTAEEILKCLGLNKITIQREPRLAPGNTAEEALESLIEGEYECVIGVGHEPLLSEMVAYLVSDTTLRLDLRKGGLVEIELLKRKPPQGVLWGLLRPAHIHED